jgi:PAS domain S-box-containing protein
MFVFTLEYTGRERYVSPAVVGLLGLYPLLVAIIVVTNPDGIFYTDFTQQVAGVGEDMTHLQGPAFVAHTLVGYALAGGVFIMILDLLFRSGRSLYRGQAVALLIGVGTPVALNVITVSGNVGYDLTVIGFIGTSTLFTVAIVQYDLINVAPIAREKVVETVRDGMIVVDTDDTVLDSNPAFRSLFGVDEESLIGLDITDLLADMPTVLDTYEQLSTMESGGGETAASTANSEITYGDRHLSIESTPLSDDRDRQIGWLFLVHDITEQVQRERDLEGQIEKLDQFAGIVSHDLRNPLNVAAGYIQQSQATGDITHLDKAEESMERMETIISEALALAREGEDVTELETVSLDTVATSAWQNVDTGAATIEIADIKFRADKKRVQRLIENLFRNSIEHGVDSETHPAEDHTVSVGFAEDEFDEVTLYIADNGVGIPDDELDNVFDDGYTTNKNGTGLGLAIVDQIATAHGWETEVTHAENGGARFELHNVPRPVGDG